MIEFSKFDSQLLNMKVGKLYLKIRTKRDTKNLQDMLKNTDYDLILVTMEDDKCLAINSLIEQGFHLSQIKVELLLYLKKFDNLQKYDVKGYSIRIDDYKLKDKRYLKKLAIELSKNSRFSSEIFSKNVSRQLYMEWLENSLTKKVSDRNYFLSNTQKNKIVGMTTVKVGGNKSEIGFMVINLPYRGKGLGKYLLSEVLRGLAMNNINTISLKTELSNYRALNFYSAFGFKFKKYIFLLEYFRKI